MTRALMVVNFGVGGIWRSSLDVARALDDLDDVAMTLLVPRGSEPVAEVESLPLLPSFTGERTLRRRLAFAASQLVSPAIVARTARRMQPDVIHFQNLWHLLAPGWLRVVHPQRVVVSVHDIDRAKPLISPGIDRAALRSAYRAVGALIVHSHAQRDALANFAGVPVDRIHVVPLPFTPDVVATPALRDEARRLLGRGPGEVVLLVAGSIRDEKNLDALLHAVQLSSSSVHLMVAGSDTPQHRGVAHYRALVDSLAITEKVSFRSGWLPEDDLTSLMMASDALVLPYASGFDSQSDFVGRAAAAWTPIISSDAPTIAGAVSAFGLGVVADGADARSLASAIDAFVERRAAGQGPSTEDFDRYLTSHSSEESARLTADVYRRLATQFSR